MKKELTIIFLTLFLVTTVLAESSDIVIWTNPNEKAIARSIQRKDNPYPTSNCIRDWFKHINSNSNRIRNNFKDFR
jgi:hypothetical protein